VSVTPWCCLLPDQVEHDQAMLRVHSEWVKAHGPPDSVTRAEKQR
jgi:hypothetical protein